MNQSFFGGCEKDRTLFAHTEGVPRLPRKRGRGTIRPRMVDEVPIVLY